MSSGPTLRMEVLDSPEELAACRTEWDACVTATDGDIYFTVDWIRTWWRHFGKGREFAAYRLIDAAGPVGVLAFVVETFWLGPFPVRVARLAGMDPNYAILGFPLRSDRAAEALELVFDDLLRTRDCNGISLSPVSGIAAGLSAIRSAAGSSGRCLVRDEGRRQHTVMHLPHNKEDYWNSLSKSRQKEFRRSRNKMQSRFVLKHHVSSAHDIDDCYKIFVSQHNQQWSAVGKGGHFSDWPGSAEFYKNLMQSLSPSGCSVVEMHFGDEKILSCRLTFIFGDRAYWRLTARTLDDEAVRMGVGKVGLVERVQKLIDGGVKTIEAGAGEYDYKLSYGGELVPLHQIVVGAPRKTFRLRLLLAWSDILDLLYYRIWFLKLAPRLRRLTGAPPRPLWRVWIRTRL